MARMPTFEEIAADFGRGVRTAEQAIEHPFRRHQTPAQPATMAPERAATQGDTMSLITDVENGYAAVKAEVAKLEGNLPQALAVAKQLEGNPIVQVALKAAEHAAANILPPEAVTYLAGNFMHDLEAMATWFMQGQQPQGAQQPPAQPQQAPAQ